MMTVTGTVDQITKRVIHLIKPDGNREGFSYLPDSGLSQDWLKRGTDVELTLVRHPTSAGFWKVSSYQVVD